jgi:hypothetical protein
MLNRSLGKRNTKYAYTASPYAANLPAASQVDAKPQSTLPQTQGQSQPNDQNQVPPQGQDQQVPTVETPVQQGQTPTSPEQPSDITSQLTPSPAPFVPASEPSSTPTIAETASSSEGKASATQQEVIGVAVGTPIILFVAVLLVVWKKKKKVETE